MARTARIIAASHAPVPLSGDMRKTLSIKFIMNLAFFEIVLTCGLAVLPLTVRRLG